MKRFFRRIAHIYWLLCSLAVRCFTKVHKKRVLCWSYNYTKYSCNPRYITEYLLTEHPGEFEIYWCFYKGIDVSSLPTEVKVIRWRTWRYLIVLNTAGFLITNARTGLWGSSFIKKNTQKYIMTWHSSMGIKKIEKDAVLPEGYVKTAQYDSSMCDLILSGCQYRTEVIKRAFWYDGEILEKGTPRNDILFKDHTVIRERIFSMYGLPSEAKILLYAPTFRSDYSLRYYKLSWEDVIPILDRTFSGNFYVLLRLHPNFYTQHINGGIKIGNNSRIIDVTSYHDMQELLCISDILVTDYSSSLFDFSLLYRPCFIYATDYTTYDRGTYFQLDKLPFPLAQTDQELVKCIENFDTRHYNNELRIFNTEIIGSYENGHACEAFYHWIKIS